MPASAVWRTPAVAIAAPMPAEEIATRTEEAAKLKDDAVVPIVSNAPASLVLSVEKAEAADGHNY